MITTHSKPHLYKRKGEWQVRLANHCPDGRWGGVFYRNDRAICMMKKLNRERVL